MKHTSLFLIIAVSFVLCSCEKTADDRQRNVSNYPKTAWLLGIQITKIPKGGLYYDCQVPAYDFYPKQLYKNDLPYYFRIEGGKLIDVAWNVSAFRICNMPMYICSLDSINAEPDTLLNKFILPDFQKLDSLKFPQEIRFENNDIAGNLIIRYTD